MAEEGEYMYMDDNLYKESQQQGTRIPFDVNSQRFLYRTAGECNNILHVAAQYENQGFIAQACTELAGCQILCQQNSKGETSLHLATHFGHVATVEALLQAHDQVQPRADPILNGRKPCWSEKVKKGDTPLHRALIHSHDNIAMLLLDMDIQLVSVNNVAHESPAYLVAENLCNIVLQKLINDD